MPRRTFSPGQRVRVRSWESMVAEFGVSATGHIPCPETFVREMREFCGEERVVASCGLGIVRFAGGGHGYTWSPEMLEPIGKRCPRVRTVNLFYGRTGHGRVVRTLIDKLCRRYHV